MDLPNHSYAGSKITISVQNQHACSGVVYGHQTLKMQLRFVILRQHRSFLGSRGLHKETRQPAGPAGVTQVIYEMQFLFISSTAGRVKKVSEIQQGPHRFCLLRDLELAAAMSNPTRRHSEEIWRRRFSRPLKGNARCGRQMGLWFSNAQQIELHFEEAAVKTGAKGFRGSAWCLMCVMWKWRAAPRGRINMWLSEEPSWLINFF